jgi:hypothetical protein
VGLVELIVTLSAASADGDRTNRTNSAQVVIDRVIGFPPALK